MTLPNLFSPELRTGHEKALLHAHLKLSRDVLLWKLEGLSEEDRRRPMTGTGTNLIGLVKHLAGVEAAYFCAAFGRSHPPLPWWSDDDSSVGEFSDMYAKPEESTEELIAAYKAVTAAADLSIEELDLDAEGRHHTGLTVSLRWMLLTLIVDTARHAGHADILRETIDGAVGGSRTWSGVNDDLAHRERYLARVRGEISTPDWYDYVRSRQDARVGGGPFEALVAGVAGKTDEEIDAFSLAVGGMTELCSLVFQGMAALPRTVDCHIAFVLSGDLCWTVESASGKTSLVPEVAEAAAATVTMTPHDFLRAAVADFDWITAIQEQRVKIEGDFTHLQKVFRPHG